MSDDIYKQRKQSILSNDSLNDHQRGLLLTDLRHERFGVDRSGLTRLDTFKSKPGIIKIIY